MNAHSNEYMKVKTFLLCVLSTVFSAISMAQNTHSVIFTKLKILDGYTEKMPENARVAIIDKQTDCVLVDSMLSSWNTHVINGEEKKSFGGFYASAPYCKNYIFRFTCKGYENEDYEVELSDANLRKYVFSEPYYVWQKTVDLPEVDVKATKIFMVMKGDTIEYNAANFRMAEGSMLDNLIRALPGAKLDNNGRISVNGEFINSLLINGRDFFNGDPKVALANLPAYTVNRIQVYRKEPDYAKDMGERSEADKKKDPMVMNVKLKREYQEGWISNYEIGGGAGLGGSHDGKWLGRMFALRYTNHSSLAVYANANNLSDAGSPSSKGEWKRTDDAQGDQKTYMGGIDFSLHPKATPTKFKTSFQVDRKAVYSLAKTLREDYYPTGNTYRKTGNTATSDRTNMRWNASLQTKLLSRNTIIIMPNAYYSRNKAEDEENTAVLGEIESMYTRKLRSDSKETNWGAGLNVTDLIFFNNKGTLDLTGDFSYNKSKRDNMMSDMIAYTGVGMDNFFERRKSGQPKYDYSYLLKALYEKHLKLWQYSVQYSYSQKFNSRHQDLYRDDEGQTTPSASSGKALALDVANSYHTTRLERSNTVELYSNADLGAFAIELQSDICAANRRIRDFRNLTKKSITRNDFIINSVVKFSHDSKLGTMELWGSIKNELPDIMNLLDVRDESDPMSHFLGNAELKTTRNSSIGYSYKLKKEEMMRIFRLTASYNKWDDSVGMAQIFDRSTGVTTYKPMNIDGNWLVSCTVNYSQFLDKSSRWNVSNSFGFNYRHSVDFMGEGKANNDNTQALDTQVVDNLALRDELRIDYRFDGFSVAALGNVNWTQMTSDNENFIKFSYTDFNYGVSLTVPVFCGLDVSTDIMAYNRRGYADNMMNTTDWVWNASVSRALGKSKQWVVKAIGFDLLHQLSNIRHTINAQGRTETWRNTTPSYATLHIIYRLDVKPKEKK